MVWWLKLLNHRTRNRAQHEFVDHVAGLVAGTAVIRSIQNGGMIGVGIEDWDWLHSHAGIC